MKGHYGELSRKKYYEEDGIMIKKKDEDIHEKDGDKRGSWTEKQRQREEFKRMALDRRRYRVFNIDDLKKIKDIIDETIESKKEEFIEDLKKQKMELEKKIDELGG